MYSLAGGSRRGQKMQPAVERKSESGAENESGTDHPLASAPPTPKSANFVSPAWRGKKYITPEVFRRRVYAYFGYRPSKSTMHRWLQGGRIEAIRIGKLWLIPESTWEEFLVCCKDGVLQAATRNSCRGLFNQVGPTNPRSRSAGPWLPLPTHLAHPI
jgi:excisionase family DNA binding protein